MYLFPLEWSMSLVHRNRSDFCDLRLRCPSRTPEIASDFSRLCIGVCAHSRPRRDPPTSLSVWSCVCPHGDKKCFRSLQGSCQPFFMSRKNVCQPAKEWDTSLGFLHSVCTSSRKLRSRGGWGSGGAFGFLGAPLPAIDPQRYRGVPWAPSPPFDSFWDQCSFLCGPQVPSQRICPAK